MAKHTPNARTQSYYDYLVQEGYRPRFDGDGDIEFKAEGFYFCWFAVEDDPNYIYLAAPNIWSIEENDSTERTRLLEQAMEMQMTYKGLKIVVLKETVWASYQGFLPEEVDFSGILPRIMDLLLTAIRSFHRKMRQEKEEQPEESGVQA